VAHDVPPLRARRDDIDLLAGHFLNLFAAEMGITAPSVHPAAMDALKSYDFPGNVRELKNIVERALIEAAGGEIRPEHLHIEGPGRPAARDTPDKAGDLHLDSMPLDFAEAEVMLIRRAVDLAGGNVSEAARQLGIDRNKIYRKLARGKDSRTD